MRLNTLPAAWLCAALPLGFIAAGLVWPALALLFFTDTLVPSAAQTEPVALLTTLFKDAFIQWRLAWTLAQALATVAVCAVLGVPLGWVLARLDWWGKALVVRTLMLPFVVPTVLAGLGVLALAQGASIAQGAVLLLYGNVFFNLCVVVRAASEGFLAVSASRVAAARSLGASPWRALWRVEWPAAQARVAAAMCLVFLYSFASFGLALMLGGQRYATLEVEIYTRVAHDLDLDAARVLALVSLFVLAVPVFAQARLSQHLAQGATLRADSIPAKRPQTTAQWAGVWTTVTLFAVLCAAPIVALCVQAIGSLASHPLAFIALLSDPDVALAVYNTLRFSAAALALATVLGVFYALAAQRLPVLRYGLVLPLMVSPVTIGFGYLVAYPTLAASAGVLMAAYALLAMPWVAQSVLSALDALPPHWAQAARSLGASPWRVFWRVTLPVIAPALRRGMAFAAASCVGEFAVSLFLSRPEWATLSTLIYQRLGRAGSGNLSEAIQLGLLLLVLCWGVFYLIDAPQDTQTHDTQTHTTPQTAHA